MKKVIPSDHADAKYAPDDGDLRSEKTADHKVSFTPMSYWEDQWIKYKQAENTDPKFWERSTDDSIFTVQDKLKIIDMIITDPMFGGIKIQTIVNNKKNPISAYFVLDDD